MQIIPAFSGLLLMLQLVSAVHLDQSQPGFIKVKRDVSGTHDGTESALPQSGLQRRAQDAEVAAKVQELIAHFDGKTSTAENSDMLSKLKDIVADSHEAETTRAVKRVYEPHGEGTSAAMSGHAFQPQAHPASDGYISRPLTAGDVHSAQLAEHNKILDGHERRLDTHEKAIGLNQDVILDHHVQLSHLEEAQAKIANAKKKSGFRKNLALGSLGLLGGTAAVTSTMYANTASHKFNDMSEELAAQQAEIKRLKAASGAQQLAAPVGGPGVGQGVPATTGQGAAASSGGLV